MVLTLARTMIFCVLVVEQHHDTQISKIQSLRDPVCCKDTLENYIRQKN